EHDYRELKDALGLDHFEGRNYRGWNHHVTLVSIAHAFLTLERTRRPQARAAARASSRSSGSCKRSWPAGRAPAPRAAESCRPTTHCEHHQPNGALLAAATRSSFIP